MLEAMAEAVEKAAVVLVCLTQKYKESPNCRTGLCSLCSHLICLIVCRDQMFDHKLNCHQEVASARIQIAKQHEYYTS